MSIELLPADQAKAPPRFIPVRGLPQPWLASPFVVLFLLVLAAGLGVLIYNGIGTRVLAESALVKETHESTALDVAITHPKQVGGAQEGDPAWQYAALHRRADLCTHERLMLRKWYADIGARLHKGRPSCRKSNRRK